MNGKDGLSGLSGGAGKIYEGKLYLQIYAPMKNQEELIMVKGGILHWN